jgi:hypothetical protein
LLLEDVFPDHRRFLVAAPGGTVVLSSDGHVLAILGADSPFEGESASWDGGFVIGTRTKADDHDVLSSTLHIRDAAGRWERQVPGPRRGLNPQLSRSGHYVAYEDLDERAVCIGILVVE